MAAAEDPAQAQAQEVPWFLKTSYPVLFPTHDALFKSPAVFDSYLFDELRGEYGVMSMESLKMEDSMDGITLADKEKESAQTDRKREDEEFLNRMLTENSDVAFISTQNALVDLFFEMEEAVSGPRLKELLDAAWAVHPLITLKVIFNARSIHLGKSSKNVFYRAAGWLAQNHPLTLAGNLRWLSRPIIEKKVQKEGENDEGFIKVEKREGDENAVDQYDVRHGVSHGYWKDVLNILVLAMEKKLDVLENPRDVLNVEDEEIKNSVLARRKRKKDGVSSSPPRRRTARSANSAKRAAAIEAAKQRAKAKEMRAKPNRHILEDQTVRIGNPEFAQQVAAFEESQARAEAARLRAVKRELKATQPTHALEEETVRIGNLKLARHRDRDDRHAASMDRFNTNAVYRTLHVTVARLFAEQLHSDLAALRDSDPRAKRGISLCAKWAPSHGNFHDRHTCIISSIAEILYPQESLASVVSAADSREVYLRYAREQYRKDVSALRKHLEVVERDISACTFDNIKYDRVPSIAMKNYTRLFIDKDMDRFQEYVGKVSEGKANISGAVLLPSTLVCTAAKAPTYTPKNLSQQELLNRTIKEMEAKVADGQWKTLVQRIKDSGTLSSCIAVCDVSGSMGSPVFKDGTTPMHSAVGLSLLVAEVTEEPFGGKFITFHSQPSMKSINVNWTFPEKVQQIMAAEWGGNTDFVAVFEQLILPLAIKNNLKQKDMVKRVFVFSDMQFDQAESNYGYYVSNGPQKPEAWASSYDRIKAKYEEHGYELPELVFWNLAGGRAGGTAPKPVLAGEAGTALVSGYSQGMLKVFMDNGMFEVEEEEEEEGEVDVKDKDEDEDMVGITATEKPKKKKMNPLATVKKAISHKAYDMLKVMD
ncbi:uncharacterized protein Triagg1_105 [Trichoderma aggressivum f. europaeum]|uniref:DUF2828 domain-containing protein n=1 Tax=Trichoderma aggressivum f. europaeum TaxID=173218 RepID=A0AAE1JIA6_9HYPO|nr:hypothetical protein Triagg1_105 [Trichoderma aggressivum f. europaeum]